MGIHDASLCHMTFYLCGKLYGSDLAHRLFDSVECRYLSLLFKRKALPIPVCDSLQCRNTVIGLYTVSSLGMAVYGIYRSPVFSLDLSRSMEKLAVDDGPSLIMQMMRACAI